LQDKYDNPKAWDQRLEFAALGFNTNYRVLDATHVLTEDGVSPYFHKSIGGYHAAKFQRYQEMIEFYIQKQRSMAFNPSSLPSLNVLNMLNTRYIIMRAQSGAILDINDPTTYSSDYGVLYNPEAYGNAWFIKGFELADNVNDEILSLENFDTRDSMIVGQDFQDAVSSWNSSNYNGNAEIKLTSYAPNHLVYEVSNVNSDQIAVFSEMYYPVGWNAYADGKKI